MQKLFLSYYTKLTIAKKLRFMAISVSVIAVFLSMTSVLIYQYYNEKNILQSQAETFSKILADNIAPAILFKDMDNISETLTSLKHQENITQVYVLDRQWKVIQSYTKNGVALKNEEIILSLKSKQFLWKDNELFTIVPISVDKEGVGSLIVVSSLNEYYTKLLKELWLILLIVILAIWLTLKFSDSLNSAILSPISNMNENINDILKTQNLTNHVIVSSNDEIGNLGKNFNLMINDLHDMHNQLIDQKEIAEYKAHHDGLTLLPNRRSFTERLNQVISRAKRNKEYFAIFFMDLDHFKQVNDSMGHDAGDEVLKIFAERIKHSLRVEDTVARMGGDEFTVILENLNSVQSPTIVAEKILKIMEEPLTVNGQQLYLTTSIGITIYPDDGQDTLTLIKNADAAMYKAKNDGRNKYQFYDVEMTDMAYARVTMETQLREAIKQEDFVVYYQPQVNIVTNELIGMEALIRWNHPRKGLLSPDYFLPLAKETGLIVTIDRWVMKTAMQQMKQWHNEGLATGYLSLNLSVGHLMRKDFMFQFKELLEQSGCEEKHIQIEITEDEVMKDPEYAISVLQQINDMGISLSIDDFGTGYSSLSYLKRLPIDTIKIDRSFINDIPLDEEDVAITKAIIALSESLNLKVIAEGVENNEQKDFLLQNGCHNIQGYLYAMPMPAEVIENFLRDKLKS